MKTDSTPTNPANVDKPSTVNPHFPPVLWKIEHDLPAMLYFVQQIEQVPTYAIYATESGHYPERVYIGNIAPAGGVYFQTEEDALKASIRRNDSLNIILMGCLDQIEKQDAFLESLLAGKEPPPAPTEFPAEFYDVDEYKQIRKLTFAGIADADFPDMGRYDSEDGHIKGALFQLSDLRLPSQCGRSWFFATEEQAVNHVIDYFKTRLAEANRHKSKVLFGAKLQPK